MNSTLHLSLFEIYMAISRTETHHALQMSELIDLCICDPEWHIGLQLAQLYIFISYGYFCLHLHIFLILFDKFITESCSSCSMYFEWIWLSGSARVEAMQRKV